MLSLYLTNYEIGSYYDYDYEIYIFRMKYTSFVKLNHEQVDLDRLEFVILRLEKIAFRLLPLIQTSK